MKKSDTKTSIRVTFWTEHTETDCDTCKRYNDTCKPGRKVKAQKGGKHVQVTNGQILLEINSLNLLPQFATKMPLSKSRFSVPPAPIKLEDFTCECCGDVLNQPVETKCRHIMCRVCLCKHILKNTLTPSCPVCSEQFESTSDVRPLANALTNILSKLEVRCDNPSCKVVVPLDNLQEHVVRCSPAHSSRVLIVPSPQSTLQVNRSQHSSPAEPLTPSKISLRSVLESPLDRVPTSAEKTAASRLVRRMLNTGELGDIVQLPTGGQVI